MFLPVLLSVLLTILMVDCVLEVVQTTEGQVQGVLANDGDYYAYYGIRYGADTSGANRFKAPKPPPSYRGVFNAIDTDVVCPQPSLEYPEVIIGTEDCLRLSIFTPKDITGNPVLVWLIGEDYTTSNPLQYSFRRLVQEKFTVVALNYRLSILGFLCLGIEEAPGNAGLKDVILALKWIKNNIERFGGDPNNVLLFGHGSGAAMADLVTLSPLAEGLLHKVISQSGSAIAPWAVSYSPVDSAFNHGVKLGYLEDNRRILAKTLISATIKELMYPIVHKKIYKPNVPQFAPCIENENLDRNNRFLTHAPVLLLSNGSYNTVPYIGGYVDREGSVRVENAVNGRWLQRMDNDFGDFVPIDLIFDIGLSNFIRRFYFVNHTIDMHQIEAYTHYHGDTLTMMSVIRGAGVRSRSSDTWLMEFTYRGSNDSDWQFPEIPPTGVRHGEILKYIFDINLDSYDSQVSDTLIGRYVNFARTGTPSIRGRTWYPVSLPFYVTLRIHNGIENNHLETNVGLPQRIKWQFWEPFYTHPQLNVSRYPPMVDSSGNLVPYSSMLLLIQLFIGLFYQ